MGLKMKENRWWDVSWNPVDGCTPVSESCENCWAASMANRFWDRPFSEIRFHPDRLEQPLKWKKSKRIFVVSLGDLFYEDVTDNQTDQIFNAVYTAPQHTYLILTKRPSRMQQYFESCRERGVPVLHWERHGLKLFLGVTAETQRRMNERWSIIQQIPASVIWVSMEPMLGPIRFLWDGRKPDWVVVGGLSLPGNKIQAPKREWVKSILDQCDSAGVPCFIKENALYPEVRRDFPKGG